jgi:hypothetical protein
MPCIPDTLCRDLRTVAHSVDNPNQPDLFARDDDTTAASVATAMRRTERSVPELAKGTSTSGVYCWGYGLGHAGVNISTQNLQN